MSRTALHAQRLIVLGGADIMDMEQQQEDRKVTSGRKHDLERWFGPHVSATWKA